MLEDGKTSWTLKLCNIYVKTPQPDRQQKLLDYVTSHVEQVQMVSGTTESWFSLKPYAKSDGEPDTAHNPIGQLGSVT